MDTHPWGARARLCRDDSHERPDEKARRRKFRDAEAEMARALVERLTAAGRRFTAEMLHELRRAFPSAPLKVRVRALAALRTA